MKIKEYSRKGFLPVSFDGEKSIYVLAGVPSFLYMMRCTLAKDDFTRSNCYEKPSPFTRVLLEVGEKEYEFSAVQRNTEAEAYYEDYCDDPGFFSAVLENGKISEAKTVECIKALRALKDDDTNRYIHGTEYLQNDEHLSESNFNLKNFNRFLEIAKDATKKGDRRPMYIFNFADRIDEAVDITPFINELAVLERQVFISVNQNYPLQRFEHRKTQILQVKRSTT